MTTNAIWFNKMIYLLYDTDINNAAYDKLWNYTNSGSSVTVGFRFGNLCSLRMVH
jgi:hypothetical protein